jgi:Ca2+-binding EF-hand superfamily protein
MSSISSISSIGGNTYGMAGMQGMRNMRKPDPSEMADNLFSKLDTAGQGHIEKADLQAAFDSISTGTDGTTDVDSIFSQLDGDSDGKVTKQELTDKLQQLADQLDEQFQSMRMQQGMSGMGGMPPPPPENDTGFTQEELSSQLEEIGAGDSTRASLISSIAENFDAADSDGDGRVSFREAMAYQESTGADSAGTTAASTAAAETDSKVMLQIMRLMQAYNLKGDAAASVSVTA